MRFINSTLYASKALDLNKNPFKKAVLSTFPVFLLAQFVAIPTASAAGISGEIEQVFVSANQLKDSLQSNTEAASVGTVLAAQIEHRPMLRPAELLETIPGMVVTQHSGGGKSNQYFLRGFNLDHGTDFANYVEGAPVNNVSHGHGQGYTDLNFLIPELLDRLVYKKGPYYASEGDFSSAGSARMAYANRLDSNKIKLTVGEDGYQRALLVGGSSHNEDNFVYALEGVRDDGPWRKSDDLKRTNVFLKWSRGDNDNGFSLSLLAFESDWNGTDQIPQRLVNDGTLGRYDSIGNTSGGDTHRYQLAAQSWSEINETTRFKANAYVVDYQLNLTTNATYYANDIPVVSPVLGVPADQITDEFSQFDDRIIAGGDLEWAFDLSEQHQLDVGVNLRYDDIKNVGVGASFNNTIYDFGSRAAIEELAYAGYASVHSSWKDWFSTIIGVRYDHFDVEVDDKLSGVTNSDDDDLITPKLSLHFGPFKDTDIFVNYGKGFHSNDARGVVAGDVPLLSESEGYELGFRNQSIDNLQLSLVFFHLELDSELVFVGDDGTTEPQDATRRKGFELSAYYQPADWLVIDADYTVSKARFKDKQYDGGQLLGDYVPDSVEDVFSMGASVEMENGIYGGLRARYFGPRKLEESGNIESDSSLIFNANLGYRIDNGVSFGLEIINLTDRDDNDITYYYASRTQQERDNNISPIDDYHSHPMVPRTLRFSVGYEF